MTLKDLLQKVEGFIVITGLLLTIFSGRVWAWATLLVYIAYKVPKFYDWIKKMLNKGKDLVDGK